MTTNTNNTMEEIKVSSKVNHPDYRICTVVGVIPEFGIALIPDLKDIRQKISEQTGMPPDTPILETNLGLLSGA